MSRNASSAKEPRERILNAAAEVFAASGFAGAGVDEIARRAGVNKAMLYYHVGDKAELYAAVLERNFGHIRDAVQAAAGEATSPSDAIRRIVESFIVALGDVPTHPPIMLREVASGAVNLPDSVLREMVAVFGLMHGLIEAGTTQGEFRAVDPVLAHLMILGTLVFMTATRPLQERLYQHGLAPSNRHTPAELADFMADVLLNGIAVRETDPDSGGSR